MVNFTMGLDGDMMNPQHEEYPHLSSEEWEALKRFSQVSGSTVKWLLLSAPPDVQKEAAVQFLERERLSQSVSTPTPQVYQRQSLKVDVIQYDGSEEVRLLRWFCEVDLAIEARHITDESLKVIFMLSNLAGRARSWAYGLRLADPGCFPTLDVLKLRLQQTFEPPQNEFRVRTEFLKLKQGRSSLHEYIQRTRFLASCLVSSPIDMATQVSVFMSGLKEGPVKQYIFREYPKTLEEAFIIAQKEDFSAKLGQSTHVSVSHDGPEPMDLSVARTDERYPPRYGGRPSNFRGKCHRCHKMGHVAANCRAPAPIRASVNVTDASVVAGPKNDNVQ